MIATFGRLFFVSFRFGCIYFAKTFLARLIFGMTRFQQVFFSSQNMFNQSLNQMFAIGTVLIS